MKASETEVNKKFEAENFIKYDTNSNSKCLECFSRLSRKKLIHLLFHYGVNDKLSVSPHCCMGITCRTMNFC